MRRACSLSLLGAVSLGTLIGTPGAAFAQQGAGPVPVPPGAEALPPPPVDSAPPTLPLTLPPPPVVGEPPPVVAAPPPVVGGPLDLRAPRPGTVPVLLEAEGPPMALHTPPDPEGLRQEYLCTTPCTLYLRRGGYTLNADASGRPLVRVDLDVRAPGQRVLLRSTSALRLVGGGTLLLFGGMFLLGGLVIGALTGHSDPPETPSERATGLAFGAGLSAVGFAGLLGGGFLLRGVGWGIKQVTPLSPSELARSAP